MKNKHFDTHDPVFWPAAILITVFVVVTLLVGEPMEKVFADILSVISNNTGWAFIVGINLFIFFCIYIGFSKYGKIKLGGKDAEPEFTTGAWFAMLFSAGMGIGLLYWGVAEPVLHYLQPPYGTPETVGAARNAMNLTFLHWGFHAWSVYAIVALSLAFFAYNKKLPLTIRSAFYPLIGDKIYKWPGDVIDVFAILATLFGLATSLGMGVMQIGAGLEHLTSGGELAGYFENTTNFQVALIVIITAMATLSIVSGIDKGVKFLSEWNVRIAGFLLAFVLVVGPTLFIFRSYFQNIGSFANDFLELSFWADSFAETGWINSMTVFYWGWWVSWSPFVGMFIARISKGRTIKEFVAGVLMVPTLLTFLWLTVMGGTAIYMDMHQPALNLAQNINANIDTALFVFLENLPFSTFSSIVAVILVMSFFVTSSDSGSLVVDSIASGGKTKTPVAQRVVWASAEGLVSAALLLGGGLEALKTAAITTGLPFLIVLTIMTYSLFKGLRTEYSRLEQLEKEVDKKSYEKRLSEIVNKNIKKKSGDK